MLSAECMYSLLHGFPRPTQMHTCRCQPARGPLPTQASKAMMLLQRTYIYIPAIHLLYITSYASVSMTVVTVCYMCCYTRLVSPRSDAGYSNRAGQGTTAVAVHCRTLPLSSMTLGRAPGPAAWCATRVLASSNARAAALLRTLSVWNSPAGSSR